MKTIDEERLESNLAYRFEYLAEFIGFDASDAAAVQASGPYLGPDPVDCATDVRQAAGL